MKALSFSLIHNRFVAVIAIVMVSILIGMQFRVSSQGDMSATYPKGFRGGTCTIETDHLLIGYSGYFIPKDYEIPEDALSAMTVPIVCEKVPNPGTLNITIDLLYPEIARDEPITLRLVKTNKDTENELLFIPSQRYPSGAITQVLAFDEEGQYILYLGRDQTKQANFEIAIPIKVGTEWWEKFTTYWPLAFIFAAAIFFYNIRKIFD
jgi:hypothetical protein